jgi:hypothetical protein
MNVPRPEGTSCSGRKRQRSRRRPHPEGSPPVAAPRSRTNPMSLRPPAWRGATVQFPRCLTRMISPERNPRPIWAARVQSDGCQGPMGGRYLRYRPPLVVARTPPLLHTVARRKASAPQAWVNTLSFILEPFERLPQMVIAATSFPSVTVSLRAKGYGGLLRRASRSQSLALGTPTRSSPATTGRACSGGRTCSPRTPAAASCGTPRQAGTPSPGTCASRRGSCSSIYMKLLAT